MAARSRTGRGLAGLDLGSLGIPSEAEYVAAYCRRTGRERIDHWDFLPRVQHVSARRDPAGDRRSRRPRGPASSAHAVQTSKMAQPIAEAAWRQVEKIERGVRGPVPCRRRRTTGARAQLFFPPSLIQVRMISSELTLVEVSHASLLLMYGIGTPHGPVPAGSVRRHAGDADAVLIPVELCIRKLFDGSPFVTIACW